MSILFPRTFTNIPGADAPGTVRWDPGFFSASGTVLNYLTGASLTNKINEIKGEMDRHMGMSDARCKGFHFRVAWEAFEHTKNVYDFTALDSLLTYLHSNYPTKKWSIEIWFVKFAANANDYVPSYLSSESDSAGGVYTNLGGYATKACIYKASVMDRGIALYQAFATHYAADTTLAAMHTGETSFDFSGASGWSVANEYAQYVRMYPAIAANAQSLQIPIFANINYAAGGQSGTEAMVALAAANHLGVGGPDTFGKSAYDIASNTDSDRITWGQRAVIGQHYSGGVWSSSGGVDYRGVIPIGQQVEEPELTGYQFGAYGSPWTFADIYDMSHNVLYNNYTMVSLTPTVYGTNSPAYTKSDAAMSYITSNSLSTRTTLPSIYV